jgi:hypothetical protein
MEMDELFDAGGHGTSVMHAARGPRPWRFIVALPPMQAIIYSCTEDDGSE